MVVAGADAGDFLQQRPRTIAPPAMAAWPSRVQCATLSSDHQPAWQLQEDALAQAAEVEQLELVNDFGVLIYGLPHFGADQQVLLQQGARDGGPLAILGAGTGLGMARKENSSAASVGQRRRPP